MKKFYYILITFVMCICTVTLTTSCSKSEMEGIENNGNNGNNGTLANGEISFEKFMAENGIEYGERIPLYDDENVLYHIWFTKSNGNIYGQSYSDDGTYKSPKRHIVCVKIEKNGPNNYTIDFTAEINNNEYYGVESYTFDGNAFHLTVPQIIVPKSSVLK